MKFLWVYRSKTTRFSSLSNLDHTSNSGYGLWGYVLIAGVAAFVTSGVVVVAVVVIPALVVGSSALLLSCKTAGVPSNFVWMVYP